MKYTEAIEKMKARISEPMYTDKLFIQDIINLVFDELQRRRELRFGKRNCQRTSFIDLINEVADWYKKVLIGLNVPADKIQVIVDTFKDGVTEAINNTPRV